ncbi:alpha/beta hydrolase, putative [Plasmodium gallinaceum]|uniref:Alpha/beta hydrolase, putative n=1 Tax=Plasmodium gallinaceum TaxID=5849 RepID=A0A1J1GM27_PLAGA|nr:alpha/beta hydrolase, putative [Plasmodium gallinaceum]CRG93488.1 alpha/beta hydrolase, putative [Plasmodium gallinaceum]
MNEKKKKKKEKNRYDNFIDDNKNKEELKEDEENNFEIFDKSKNKKKINLKKIKIINENKEEFNWSEEEFNQKKEKNKNKKKDKKEINVRIIKKKNQCYSLDVIKNMRFLNTNEFINDDAFFVFPHNRNVVDLERKGNSSLNKEMTSIFKNNKTKSHEKSKKVISQKINEKKLKGNKKTNEEEKEQTSHGENNELSIKKNENEKYVEEKDLSTLNSIISIKEDTTMSIVNSLDDSGTNDHVDNYINFESKDKIGKNEEDMLFNYNNEQNINLSIGKFEDLYLEGGEESYDKVKEEKWENNNGDKEKIKISKVKGDEEKKQKLYMNKCKFKKKGEVKDNREKYNQNMYSEKYQNNRKKEEEKYITYKIPRYLKKKNIRCPFVYRSVFYGKYGIINYDLKGNDNDTLVITFHGLNGTNLTFLEMQNVLIRYKFQVLNFDLYGHGLSACPKYNHKERMYGIDFFLSQTEELLNHLKLQHKEFYLVGFSMGCIIATSFARKYIKQVKKIILISPVGVLEKKPFLLKLLKIFPCIINISSFFMLPCFISKKKLKNNDSQNDTSDYLYNRIMWQAFVKKNITHSILGCVNNLKMWSAHDIFKEVGVNNIPVLILCGENDNICDVDIFKNLSKYFINSHLIIFKNASHLVLVEKSQEVISCALTFFHFPHNADLKLFHYMLPVDKMGNYVVKDKRFSKKYSSSKSYLKDIGYIPNIFISFIDKEQEYKFKKKKKISLSFNIL